MSSGESAYIKELVASTRPRYGGIDPSCDSHNLAITDGLRFIYTETGLSAAVAAEIFIRYRVRLVVIETPGFMFTNAKDTQQGQRVNPASLKLGQMMRQCGQLEGALADKIQVLSIGCKSIRSLAGCKINSHLALLDKAGKPRLTRAGQPMKASADAQIKAWLEGTHLPALDINAAPLLAKDGQLNGDARIDAYLAAYAGYAIANKGLLRVKYGVTSA